MLRFACCAVVLIAIGSAYAADPELHVVAIYTGNGMPRDRSKPGKAAVKVDRPGKDVVLVIDAYDPVEWEVTATTKTKLTKVIVCGYYRQSAKVPEGATVEELFREGSNGARPVLYGRCCDVEAPQLRRFVRAIHNRTKLEISSFQGTFEFADVDPIVVNTIQKDERLSSDFPKLTPTAQLPKFQFEATRLIFNEQGHHEKNSFGTFTQSGPTTDSFKKLPNQVRFLTYVAKDKFHYGLSDNDLYTVAKDGKVFNIGRHKDLSRARAITYDAKRDRVLISARSGLFEYTPQNGGMWTQLIKEQSDTHAALVWQSKTDTLFGFRVESDPMESSKRYLMLCELNTNGTLKARTMLHSPLFLGILGDGAHAELIDLGDNLALLIHGDIRSSGTGKHEAFLYVLDPKTGKVKLAWKE